LYSGLEKSFNPAFNEHGVEFLFDEFINRANVSKNIRTLAQSIKSQIFDKGVLDENVQKIFLNQLLTSVRYAYLAYRLKYDFDSEEKGAAAMRFVSDLLQSELADKQTYDVQRSAKHRVYTLRHNPALYNELKEKYDFVIEPSVGERPGRIILNAHGNASIKLYTYESNAPYIVNVTRETDKKSNNFAKYSFGTTGVSSSTISMEFFRNFIEDVTGLVLPTDAKNIFDTANPGKRM
jgi:hypothetical protein